MKKILRIISVIILITAFGHDVYLFYQNQEKGFHFSDIGWIWDKYNPQSHKEWNEEIKKVINQAKKEQEQPEIAAVPDEKAEAMQVDDGTATIRVSSLPKDDDKKSIIDKSMVKVNKLTADAAQLSTILMKQKAVVVAGIFTIFIYFITWFFGLFSGKFKRKGKDELDFLDRKKGGTYKYKRK